LGPATANDENQIAVCGAQLLYMHVRCEQVNGGCLVCEAGFLKALLANRRRAILRAIIADPHERQNGSRDPVKYVDGHA
jgi:hypothetical protein